MDVTTEAYEDVPFSELLHHPAATTRRLDAVRTFLPAEDVDTLLTELVDTVRGAVALDNLAPIALLLAQWRHSAEIYADPALLAILTREPEGDLGPVPTPGRDK